MGHQIPKPPRDHMIPINPPYGPQGLGALVDNVRHRVRWRFC